MLYYRPDPLEAKQRYEQSVALYEEVGDRWGLARALAYLGWMAEHLGHYGEAQALCERSLAIRHELGDQRGMADAMLNLGIISWVQGRLDEAHRLLRESLGIFRALDDWNRVAHAIKSMGEVLVRRGLFEDGLALMESSADIYDDLGYSYGVLGLLPFLAGATSAHGPLRRRTCRRPAGDGDLGQAKHRWGVGFCPFCERTGRAGGRRCCHEALALFQAAAALLTRCGSAENRGWVLGPLGLAARAAGDTALARKSCRGGATDWGGPGGLYAGDVRTAGCRAAPGRPGRTGAGGGSLCLCVPLRVCGQLALV